MSDARAIGLAVLVVAIVATLARGPGGAASSQQEEVSGDRPLPASSTSAGACSGLDTVTAAGGGEYAQYPVSRSNSLGCTLEPGDDGEPVAALQRALALCAAKGGAGQPVRTTGTYDARTRRAVTALGGEDGVYGPAVATRLTWPWFSASGRTFTGRCSPARTSS